MAATALQRETKPEVLYPDSDGEPIAKNTIQYQYIGAIQVGLDAMFARNPDVFVAADLLWYPVEGRPDIKNTPDVMVAFGRPKGIAVHTGSGKRAASPRKSYSKLLLPAPQSPKCDRKGCFTAAMESRSITNTIRRSGCWTYGRGRKAYYETPSLMMSGEARCSASH